MPTVSYPSLRVFEAMLRRSENFSGNSIFRALLTVNGAHIVEIHSRRKKIEFEIYAYRRRMRLCEITSERPANQIIKFGNRP